MIEVNEYVRIADRWQREDRLAAELRERSNKPGRRKPDPEAATLYGAEAGVMLRTYYPGATAVTFRFHRDNLGMTAGIEAIFTPDGEVHDGDDFEDQSDVGDFLVRARLAAFEFFRPAVEADDPEVRAWARGGNAHALVYELPF